MGQGICAREYIGDRHAQELFRLRFGGNPELPIDIRRRLDERQNKQRRRIKKRKYRQS